MVALFPPPCTIKLMSGSVSESNCLLLDFNEGNCQKISEKQVYVIKKALVFKVTLYTLKKVIFIALDNYCIFLF